MSTQSRMEALERARLVHPRPDAVTAELFCSANPFFLAADKVQVKYEMLRAVAIDELTVVAAAEAHGYSRAEFYLVQAAFTERGMASRRKAAISALTLVGPLRPRRPSDRE